MPIEEKETGPNAAAGGRRSDPARPDFWRAATAICLSLTVVMALIAGVIALIYGSGRFHNGERDFVQYWVVGQLLVHGENPYGIEGNSRLERSIGVHRNYPGFNIAPNPPVIFWLTLPLGLVGIRTAAIFWLLLLLVGLAASIRMIWVLNGRPGGGLYLLGLCFTPVIYCVMIGQLGILLLLCVTAFLLLHNSRPFAAGAVLAFCMVKPHLFLPLGAVLILWGLQRRSYRLLMGFAAALAATVAIAFWLDPHAWGQWAELMRSLALIDRPVPTLSRWFRRMVDEPATWVQFVPEIAGCLWGAWYFWTRRARWNWMDEGLLLTIVSVGCAPFAWVTDEALLLPALLTAAYRAQRSGRSLLPLALILAAELFELLRGAGLLTSAYVWAVPAYLGWYLYATWRSQTPAAAVESTA